MKGTNMTKTRYALCGLSTRGIYHFALPLLGLNREGGPNFDAHSELVGIIDLDLERVAAFLGKIGRSIPSYRPEEFARMIAETRPDVVLVATPDYSHAEYIVQGLLAGCDVIAEKPMVINCEQVRQVQAAEKKSGRTLRVAFNYRYTPTHQRLKRMIVGGELGRITNVEFTYNLDTWHGSSYFYRWNRERAKSGGLCMHKCCHHFDLINWWLGDMPEEVFAFGARNYYGPNGALRPLDAQGFPLGPAEEKRNCPVFRKHYADKTDPASNDISTGWDEFGLPYDIQYPPEQRRYIYDDAIDIEDTYSAVVRYRTGTSLSYSCNFCTPWEGYVLGINGTKGRVEIVNRTDPDPTGKTNPAAKTGLITFYPLFGGKQLIEIPPVAGGHGGADFTIQRDLFDQASNTSRELNLVAGSAEGASSVAISEAVWRSIAAKRLVNLTALLQGTE
jgi:predicted dehydrogenase